MEKERVRHTAKRIWSIKTRISNIVWFLLGGLWLGLIFVSIGLALCLTVVGIPLGKTCFRHAWVSMFPYGKRVEIHSGRRPIANLLWAILIGWWFSFLCLVTAVLCIATVVGFFRGLQAFKLARLTFFPFGATVIENK